MRQNFFNQVKIEGRVRVCLEKLIALDLKNKNIVDIGSSIGWLEKEMVKYHPKKMIGVEPAEDGVAFAKKNVKEAEFFVGTADKLPVEDDWADIAVIFDVIEHVPPDKEQFAFNELSRVLKKGGKLALSTPNNHFLVNILDPAWYFGHRHYTKEHLIKGLNKAGLKVEEYGVRGGIWFSFNLVHHYFMKWVMKKPFATNKFLSEKSDRQFSEPGISTVYLIAKKL